LDFCLGIFIPKNNALIFRSTLAGYMLAILSILSTTKVGTLLVVLSVPIVDTTYVVIGRLIHGKSPVWGDRTHLHHRLLDIGWGKRKIAVFYWLTTAFLGFWRRFPFCPAGECPNLGYFYSKETCLQSQKNQREITSSPAHLYC